MTTSPRGAAEPSRAAARPAVPAARRDAVSASTVATNNISYCDILAGRASIERTQQEWAANSSTSKRVEITSF
jgi:hypothetical protein